MGQAVEVSSHRVRSLIGDVVVEMSAALDDSASTVSEAIHSRCHGLEDELYLSTRQSTRANLGLITTLLGQGAGPTAFSPPEEALSYARSYVHEGLSFELLSRVYREGERAYTRLWLDRLRERVDTAGELADCMGYFSDWLFAYIETINRPLSEVYTAEHERWIRGGVAMRSEEVRSILAGAHVNVTEASGRLRYRLDARHVGLVIWRQTPESGDLQPSDARTFEEMDQFAAEVADSLGAHSALTLPIGRYYAGWAAVGPDVDFESLPSCRNSLRVALGRVGRGVDGFRRTHQEALHAKRVASLNQRPSSSCMTFTNLALDALLTQDLDEARRFVQNELGPLVDDSDANRRLTATLEVFYQEESSYVRAARRLGIHENTVCYRVRRAEELLGRPITERQLEVQAALRLARLVHGEATGDEVEGPSR
jgi:hypothetical protein